MSFVFEKLTPKTDANLEVYKDAFGFVFSNNDVKNVAILPVLCGGVPGIQ